MSMISPPRSLPPNVTSRSRRWQLIERSISLPRVWAPSGDFSRSASLCMAASHSSTVATPTPSRYAVRLPAADRTPPGPCRSVVGVSAPTPRPGPPPNRPDPPTGNPAGTPVGGLAGTPARGLAGTPASGPAGAPAGTPASGPAGNPAGTPAGNPAGADSAASTVAAVQASMADLDQLDDLPVADHVARYDALHGTLSEALAAIDGV